MNKWIYISVVAIVFVVGPSSIGWSVQNPEIANPSIRNPAGLSTVPPSSLESGLVNSPNPLDHSGNLAGNYTITGNVRRGRYFRAAVPYDSTTDFGAPLGSTSLDSFLRDSAGYEDFGEYSGKYEAQPFFSWTKTVPSTTVGRPGVFKPIDSRVSERAPDVFGLEVLDSQNAMSRQDDTTSSLVTRTTPLTREEIDRLASGQARVSPEKEPVSAESYQKLIDQTRLDLLKTRSGRTLTGQTATDTQVDTEKEDLLRLLPQPGAGRAQRDEGLGGIRQSLKPGEEAGYSQLGAEPPRESLKTEQRDTEVLNKEALDKLLSPRMQEPSPVLPKAGKGTTANMADLEKLVQQIAELKRRSAALTPSESLQVGVEKTDAGFANISDEVLGKKPEATGLPGTNVPPDTISKSYKDLVLQNDQGDVDQVTTSEVERMKNLSKDQVSIRVKEILGEHKTRESFSQARFKEYMAKAQANMKQGKCYQAANDYAQAAVFNPKDPDALAGRSLALFGAGEYISSALFLSRAIEMSPEYVKAKVDLGNAMGDRDKLETRIVDAEEWLERSCAPELEFLLAYMHYRNGRLEPAGRAIQTAEKEMPNSEAVKILKEAIDAASNPSKPK